MPGYELISNSVCPDQLTDKICDASLEGNPERALTRWQLGVLKKMENCSIILQDLAWEVSPRLTKVSSLLWIELLSIRWG